MTILYTDLGDGESCLLFLRRRAAHLGFQLSGEGGAGEAGVWTSEVLTSWLQIQRGSAYVAQSGLLRRS